MFGMHIQRNLIDAPGIDALDYVAGLDVAEQSHLAAQLFIERMLCAAYNHIGLDAGLLQHLDRVLRRLCLKLLGGTQVRYQCKMD